MDGGLNYRNVSNGILVLLQKILDHIHSLAWNVL